MEVDVRFSNTPFYLKIAVQNAVKYLYAIKKVSNKC